MNRPVSNYLLGLVAACCALPRIMSSATPASPPMNSSPPPWSALAEATGKPLSSLPGPRGKPLPDGWYFSPPEDVPLRASLVCLHGIQTHADWFAPLARELTGRGYALYCPNRRGSGRDPANDGTARVESSATWVQDAETVIAAAQSSRKPVYLLGTSWGAKVALGALAHDSSQVDGTILLVPALKTTKETFWQKLRVKVRYLLARNAPMSLPLHATDYVPRPPSCCAKLPEVDKQFIADMRSDQRVLHHATPHFQKEARSLQENSIEALNKMEKKPAVLMLFADGDRVVKENESRDLLLPACPGLDSRSLKNTGHGVQIQDAGQVATQIEKWVREHHQPNP